MSGRRHSVRKECFALSSSNRVCLNVRPLLQASSCPASGLVLSKGGAQATLALLCSALRGGAPARCLATHKCHKCALAVWQSKASIVVLRAGQRSPTRILGSAAPQSKLPRSLISTLCFDQADDQCWQTAGSSQFARVVKGVDLRSTADRAKHCFLTLWHQAPMSAMGSNPCALAPFKHGPPEGTIPGNT